jgi:cytidine deaminase
MNKKEFQFSFDVYSSAEELNKEDAALLNEARKTTGNAYAPYSNFKVGAVAKLSNGELVSGTNQENASYPVGLCAERGLLSSVASRYPGVAIDTIAISYHNHNGESDRPVSPCGMCRQSLLEYEERTNKPIRLILSGMKGEVIVVEKASQLLPLSFGSDDLK